MKATTCCLILVAGNSLRFKNKENKLFYKISNTAIIEYTLNEFKKVFTKNKIYIVVNKSISNNKYNLLQKYSSNKLIVGGPNRSSSVRNGIKKIPNNRNVLVHDGARPLVSKSLIIKIKKEIEKDIFDIVIPFIHPVNSIRQIKNNKIKYLNKTEILSIQTPQAIKLSKINANYILNNKIIYQDESELFNNKKFKSKYILGDKSNLKITSNDDIAIFTGLLNQKIRIGNAFDLHTLSKGKELILGGVKIPSKYKLVGHSDGDVVIHAIIDCILGALSNKDIGSYFPSNDKKLKNTDSSKMLKEVMKKNNIDHKIISNLDITIITEVVRLEKHKIKIKNNISKLLVCPKSKINIKAKTSDGVGIIGSAKAIACWATIIIYK